MNLSKDFYKIYNGVRSKITLFDNLSYKRFDEGHSNSHKYKKRNGEVYFMSQLEDTCNRLNDSLQIFPSYLEKLNSREISKCLEMFKSAQCKINEMETFHKNNKLARKFINLLIKSREELSIIEKTFSKSINKTLKFEDVRYCMSKEAREIDKETLIRDSRNIFSDIIKNGKPASFEYNGKTRVVEIYTHGITSRGNEAIEAYDVNNDGIDKTFIIENMSNFKVATKGRFYGSLSRHSRLLINFQDLYQKHDWIMKVLEEK